MVEILDTTLREGEQTPYVNFTVDEKVEIARSARSNRRGYDRGGRSFRFAECGEGD